MANKTDLRALDRIATPDQWREIGHRSPTLAPPPERRPARRIAAGTVAVLVAAAALLFLVSAFHDRTRRPVASVQPTVGLTSSELVAFVTSDHRIAVIRPDGTGERRLTTGEEGGAGAVGLEHVGDSSPQWSSDGSTIYFVRAVSDQAWLCSVRADGSAFEVIDRSLDGGHIVLSPDGSRFAYDGNDGLLHVIGVEGSSVPIPDARRSRPGWEMWGPDRPAWSPDGGEIAFAGPADGTGRGCWNDGCALWVLDLDTGALRNLTVDRPAEKAVSVVWAPDDRLVYTSLDSGSSEAPLRVWSIDADGSDRRELPSDGRTIPVTYAPDGSSLLVGRFGPFPYTASRGLFVDDGGSGHLIVADASSAFGDWRA